MERFDVVVIGAGPGGYPAAIRSAQLGKSVALVEKENLGGVCLNWGCIPTKALIASSELFHKAKHASDMGVNIPETSCDYAAITKRKDDIVDKLRTGVSQLVKGNGIRLFEGTASFVERNRLSIDGKLTIEAANTIIATGSSSVLPGFLPKSDRIVDSRAFLGLTKLPASMIVLGGGVIGCELACVAAKLGTQVTIVEMLDDIIMPLDKDVRRELRRHMERTLNIQILTGHSLENVTASATSVSGTVAGKKIEAELLLAAIGRKPVTDGLDLERHRASFAEQLRDALEQAQNADAPATTLAPQAPADAVPA